MIGSISSSLSQRGYYGYSALASVGNYLWEIVAPIMRVFKRILCVGDGEKHGNYPNNYQYLSDKNKILEAQNPSLKKENESLIESNKSLNARVEQIPSKNTYQFSYLDKAWFECQNLIYYINSFFIRKYAASTISSYLPSLTLGDGSYFTQTFLALLPLILIREGNYACWKYFNVHVEQLIPMFIKERIKK